MKSRLQQPSNKWLIARRVRDRRSCNPRYLIEPLESRLLLSTNTNTYINTASGSWNNATNWSTGNIPQPGDDVVIDQPGNIQVTVPASVSVNSVSLTGDTLVLQSGASLTTAADFDNSGTVSVNPDGQIVVGGNFVQTAAGSLSMPGGGATTAPTANLLTNAGFESPVIGASNPKPPSGWIASGSALISNTYAYTGSQSLQMNGTDSSLWQSVSVTPGTSYTLSVYAMTPVSDELAGSEAGFYQIQFFDSHGNLIDPGAAPVYVITAGSVPGGPLAGSAGAAGWNAFNTSAVAPANAVTAKAILITNDSNGIGTPGGSTFWDDPQFGPSAAAPSTLSAATISNSGTITVGPTNTITVSGTLTQTATGTLDIQLGGAPATGDFGSVSLTGAASLAGTLESDIVYNYSPSTNDIFTPIEFPANLEHSPTCNCPAVRAINFKARSHSRTSFSVPSPPRLSSLRSMPPARFSQ